MTEYLIDPGSAARCCKPRGIEARAKISIA
jgi:hypothetical protein